MIVDTTAQYGLEVKLLACLAVGNIIKLEEQQVPQIRTLFLVLSGYGQAPRLFPMAAVLHLKTATPEGGQRLVEETRAAVRAIYQ